MQKLLTDKGLRFFQRMALLPLLSCVFRPQEDPVRITPSIDFIISIVVVGRRGVIKLSYLGFQAIQKIPIIQMSLELI